MGLADTFGKEDRVEIKVSELIEILKEGVRSELVMNAVDCNVPHQYIREMATGKLEALQKAGKEAAQDAAEQVLQSET